MRRIGIFITERLIFVLYRGDTGSSLASHLNSGSRTFMDRHYIEIPGTHELPPLLVRTIPEEASRAELVHRATEIVETEDMVVDFSAAVMEQRKLDLAIHLTDQYLGLLTHWAWGDSV